MTLLHAFLLILVLFAEIFAVRPSSATTIVVLKTRSEIVAAADSMGRFVTGSQRTSHRFCKIHAVHEFFIASAGFYDTRPGQSMNIHEIVKSVANKGDSMALVVERSSRAIANALTQALSQAKKDDPLYKLLVSGNVVTFFFGFENGKPAAYMNQTVITPGDYASAPGIESSQKQCGPLCIPPERKPYLLHTSSQAMDDFHSNNAGLLQDNPLAFVRSAIAADIAANGHRSGPPVDVLRIDQTGPKWIDKKAHCP